MTRPPPAALGLLLALPLIALWGWIALHRSDAPAPDARDLRLEPSRVATAENGFALFEAAAEAARLPRDEPTWRRFHAFRAGETWEPDWISELVARNAAATELLRASLATPAFAFARDGGRALGDRMATRLRIQQLVALAGARARILLREGRAREAIELASLGLQVGKRVSAAENVDLFALQMARSYQTVSLIDLEHAARSAPLAPDTARALGMLLESTRWSAGDWQRAWALEYERLLAALGAVDVSRARAGEWSLSGWPLLLLPGAYRWQPNRTASALVDLYRDQSRKSTAFCASAGLRDGDRIALPRRTGLVAQLAPNGMGRLVIDQVRARSLDPLQLERCQLETHISLLGVLIAAKAYSDAEGSLPERLEDLVPRYLDALPLDRYDGAPLRYARALPAVYSVGKDFADAGGGERAPNLLDPREPALSLAF